MQIHYFPKNVASELRHALSRKYPPDFEKLYEKKNANYYIHSFYMDYMFKCKIYH